MSTPLSPSASDVQKEIESVLENDEAYGSNVTILNWSSTPTKITGKFKDAWNDRVFDFTIDEDGVGYKPSVNLDAVPVESQESRFDSFSDGYLSGIRIDGKLTGKRTKKPKCGGTSFGCGYSCIGLTKVCRITPGGKKIEGHQGSNISKERLIKLVTLAKKLNSEGDKTTALARYEQAKSLKGERDKHILAGKEKQSERLLNQPLSNKEFKVLNNTGTREKLSQWIELNKELNAAKDRRGGTKGLNKKRVEAATEIIESLFDMMDIKDAKFGGIVDSKGNLQSAYVYRETEKGYYVDFLASAPWNCLESHPNKKTGAGASALEGLIRASVAKDKGQVELESTKDAVPFYKKVGFTIKNKGLYPDMILTKESAKKFLKTQNEKNRQDADLVSRVNDLTELELLEEQALGLFTLPKGYISEKMQKG